MLINIFRFASFCANRVSEVAIIAENIGILIQAGKVDVTTRTRAIVVLSPFKAICSCDGVGLPCSPNNGAENYCGSDYVEISDRFSNLNFVIVETVLFEPGVFVLSREGLSA